jgi:GNAT superfamily N-acetyltransferase
MAITIDSARPGDADAIAGLISANRLPLDGLREHLDTAGGRTLERGGVGVAALEVYEDGVLMRSVAVAPALHGQGLGHRLHECGPGSRGAILEVPHAYLPDDDGGGVLSEVRFRAGRTDRRSRFGAGFDRIPLCVPLERDRDAQNAVADLTRTARSLESEFVILRVKRA